MSYEAVISCNCCGAVGDGAQTAKIARAGLRERGWACLGGGVDICLDCQKLADAPHCPICTQPATWAESGTRLAGRIYPATCTKCGPIEVKFRRAKPT